MRIIVIVSVLALVACQSISKLSKQKYKAGIAAWEAGEQEQSIRLMEEAVADSPKYHQAYLALGQFHTLRRENDEAVIALTKALALKEEDVSTLLWLGKAYTQRGDYLKGQYQYTQVLKNNPTRKQAFEGYLGKGICKFELTLVEDAAEYLEKALSLNPEHPDAIFYNALLREAQMGPNQHSMQSYEAVLKKDPRHLGALEQIGNTWRSLDHDKKATTYYEKYIDNGGDDSSIKEYLERRKAQAEQKQEQEQESQEEQEVVMVCPECGRIGRKGQTTCDFDGSPLAEQN